MSVYCKKKKKKKKNLWSHSLRVLIKHSANFVVIFFHFDVTKILFLLLLSVSIILHTFVHIQTDMCVIMLMLVVLVVVCHRQLLDTQKC